jgi:cyclic di-GMP phosphodiesterase
VQSYTDTPESDSGRSGTSATASESARPSVLVAGNRADTAVLCNFLRRSGFAVTYVVDGWTAIHCLTHERLDLAIVDRDLTGIDGAELCRRAKQNQATRLLPIVLLLPDFGSPGERLDAIEAGADQIVRTPIEVHELLARLRALVRQKRYTDDLEVAASVMTTLSMMIEARDRYSEGHCHRMANYAAALGRRIGLSGEDIHVLRRGGFLHDVGMLAIPDALLLKPAGLGPDERALIQSHTVVGESLIANLRSLQPVRSIVRHHHERRDGSGYPDGLQGDHIPLAAQIVGLVDVFEALTSPRPYQRTRSTGEALAMLRNQARTGWHREDLVNEFARIVTAGS